MLFLLIRHDAHAARSTVAESFASFRRQLKCCGRGGHTEFRQLDDSEMQTDTGLFFSALGLLYYFVWCLL